MELTKKLLTELQNRLKIGNRRGVHLNAIPANSRYKFDLNKLSYIDKNLPKSFINSLLTEQPLKYKISWKDNVPDLNSLFEEDQAQLVKITKSFENLINQTEAIESEKGINTFGFGFPIIIRRDQLDNKLTVAPILIWSLRIKRTKDFNTWEINRNEDDPIYLNEVLINHLQNDCKIEIEQIPSEMLDDGLIDKNELIQICYNLIKAVNTTVPDDLKEILFRKFEHISSIGDKTHYEKLPLNSTNSFIEFGGLFSIFEVQKQNIINDYSNLLELEGLTIDLEDIDEHSFQSISSVETDPSQQSILHSLESTRNVLIQGPPGTGKSQTLTAILINALENHKKTIVVCEKRTALEVLHNALIQKKINNNCILIRDIIKDRKVVVDSVRNRIDNSSYRRYQYGYSKESLENIINKAKSLINAINNKHKKLDEKLLNNKSWTNIVGTFLLELRNKKNDNSLNLNSVQFNYSSKELNDIIDLIEKGESLYNYFKLFEKSTFLNPQKLTGENPYLIEQNINADFEYYKSQLNRLIALVNEYKSNKLIKRLLTALKHNKLTKSEMKLLVSKINNDNWVTPLLIKGKLDEQILEIQKIITNKKICYSNPNYSFINEFNWSKYYTELSDNSKFLINELKSISNWRNAFLIFYLNSMLMKSASTDLPINENEHIELESVFSGIEREQLKYIQDFWYSKQIDATREFELINENLTVENLYNKRSSNRYKRLSLRQIVQYDPDLFTTFFPIILTSPDVCCNLFKDMNGYFDIVLFDEASQLRLEDNLPAILKGKQVIIAGDEHQMPPSNYFSKIYEGSVEDEDDLEEDEEIVVDKDNILLSCESLLEFATELRFEKKYLDFHYRSRHPYLIDFSNYAFYHQRLKPIPNNFNYVPIKYIQVNGTFSEYTNELEAEMVLSIIENNINMLPNGKYPTVGVATFNIAQRNLIKSKIIERQKFSKYELFNSKIQELDENGMFIKNLENIQGDERDVIILSTTYGIGKEGKFAERFGPINHSKGYKLLNVIITRAKYKVYVCSSIPEQRFMNYKEYLSIEGSNNKKAVLYAYLAYCKAVSESNNELRLSVLKALSENTPKSTIIDTYIGVLESPFEEEVFQSLLENFDEKKLIPQLQFAGFRIDIVYDPKIEGVPKVAIECDGAKYHSSQEAYLFDRHRQKILEENGFVFHRIWSTNWWRNPKAETSKLVNFIRNVESTSINKAKDFTNISQAFSHEEITIENYISKKSYKESEVEKEEIQVIEESPTQQKILYQEKIKLFSIVKLMYININKEVKIQIVESINSKIESMNGVQKINIKSPLSLSILGHTVKDIVKIGNLDNYVEIIEIIN